MDDVRCRSCGERALEPVERFGALSRVTSDTKPFPAGGWLGYCACCGTVQKRADRGWLEEIRRIYADYAMYAQAGGEEQRVFDASGAARTRSERLLERALPGLPERDEGTLLDVGCGTGVTLAAFARLRPGWRLYGQDLDRRYLGRLCAIPGFVELVPELPGDTDLRLDVITSIHSLEHFVEPRETLASLQSALRAEGRLLIQVPDAAQSPFDLVVADHLCHFEPETLRALVTRAGYDVQVCDPSWLPKEISLLARPTGVSAHRMAAAGVGAACTKARLEAQLGWLAGVQAQAAECAEKSESFGIFGTAIAGTWLFGALEERTAFFVDEDRTRVGRSHLGRPILAPEEVPGGASVYVPLLPEVAGQVAARHARGRANFVVPPPLGRGERARG